MNASLRRVTYSFIFLALCSACDGSGDSNPRSYSDPVIAEAEAAATAVVRGEIDARNMRDLDTLVSLSNYPQVRFSVGVVAVRPNIERMRQLEEIAFAYLDATGWDHSEWEKIEVIQSSASKVHVAATFSRFDASGNKYLTSDTFWAITKQDDHWGIKFRSSYGEVTDLGDGSSLAEAKAEALNVVEAYIEARNNRDSDALSRLNNYPQVLLADTELRIFDTPEEYMSYEENEVIRDLDYAEWDHSSLDKVRVFQSSPEKVHVTLQYEHVNVIGKRIGVVTGAWVITKEDNHWGIKGRSLL